MGSFAFIKKNKNPLIFIIFGIFFYTSTSAQTIADSAAYNKGLSILDSAKTVQDFKLAGNYFIKLSKAEHNDWLAPLYAGLSYVLAGFKETNIILIDELCDIAERYIDIAALHNADVSELSSIQAFIYQVRIEVSPMKRGLLYSLKAEYEIIKAKAANPNDPRPYFLSAMNTYYTPKLFGGGADAALPYFIKAAEKFEDFVPKMPFYPTWGKQQNLDMIEKCKKEL